jgi:hypothetical protein|tara:strand:+ start:4456 stop:4596 length:141 start_codon:yes stop_codon:yes gene_type:complete
MRTAWKEVTSNLSGIEFEGLCGSAGDQGTKVTCWFKVPAFVKLGCR